MGVKKELQKLVHAEAEIILLIVLMTFIFIMLYPPARNYLTILLFILGFMIFLEVLRGIGIIQEIKEYERLAIFRFGNFYKIAGPGWVFVFPFIDKGVKLDLRVQKLDLPPQEVITADQIRVTIDTIVYYKIKDPAKAVLNVQDFLDTVAGYIYAAVRDISSNLTLNELYSEIEKLNDIVKVKMQPLLADWGIDIIDVEVKDIRIPEQIQQAMHMRRKALEEWNAVQYQARAQRTLIETIAEAAKNLDEKALQYLYIKEALPKIAEGKSTKIVFPTIFPNLPQGVDKGGEEVRTLNLSGLLDEEKEDKDKKKKVDD